MTSNTFSKKDQDFANAMATKLRLNKEKLKQTLTPDEKINQLTPKQKEEIGEFRLSIIREGLKEFPGLDLKDALQMLEEFGGQEDFTVKLKGIYKPTCTPGHKDKSTKKETAMKKIIWKELKEDDPIFKQGFIISSHNKKQIDLVKIPKKMTRKEKIKHLTKSLIKLGWKLVEDK